jgi:excisionase family DNA binding protein
MLLMAVKKTSPILNVAAAAVELGVSARQVRNLITAGVLPATKLGRDYVIQQTDLAAVPRERKRGPKPKDD